MRVLGAVVILVLVQAEAAPSGSGRQPPPRPAPPAPPPPAVVFVSDREIEGATRIAAANEVPSPYGGGEGGDVYGTPLSEARPGRASRRGTLVARTREVSAHAVPQHIALVTAEGVRVRPSELTGLSLPFLLQDNVPPLPAGAARPPRPTDVEVASASAAATDTPPQQPLPDATPPAVSPPRTQPRMQPPFSLRPPSPRTVVTYFSLGEDADVKTIPYLQLVERLVGKEAYAPPPPPPPAPAPTTTPPPPPRVEVYAPPPRSSHPVYGPPPPPPPPPALVYGPPPGLYS
ncbi:hypothetical protein ONE63_002553 [Megalurothrips usitatus]|uniref:Uncharacterized protein n=1 Tax=Megalurothrips usitatus TaxID=439358 RepID=A0AAV7XD19_9NEOP|nr:hypothetical protein ONE63_002553 [Megalurothrips usitatus]